jgi:hypothetical protein
MGMRHLLQCVLITAFATVVPVGVTAAHAAAGPTVSDLVNGGYPCSVTDPPRALSSLGDDLEAIGADAPADFDNEYDFTFELWPVADQSDITTMSYRTQSDERLHHGSATVPTGTLVDGGTYNWHVRMSDRNGTSEWSRTCAFTYDTTAPAEPTITSPNYPPNAAGPLGQLAQFTFDSNGDVDTAGFEYTWSSVLPVLGCSLSGPHHEMVCPNWLHDPDVVQLRKPGGRATINLNPPSDGGPVTLQVRALDRAGNVSSTAAYQTWVADSTPIASQVGGFHQICGSDVEVKFAPHPGLTGVIGYEYGWGLGDPPLTSVPANAQGFAWADVPISHPFLNYLQVRSINANGFVSDVYYLILDIDPRPTVSADIYQNDNRPHGGPGVIGTFNFATPEYPGLGLPPATSFQYQFGSHPVQTVAADTDTSTASVPWSPDASGHHTLRVWARPGQGAARTCGTTYTFVSAH